MIKNTINKVQVQFALEQEEAFLLRSIITAAYNLKTNVDKGALDFEENLIAEEMMNYITEALEQGKTL